jgi:hypothetical protein
MIPRRLRTGFVEPLVNALPVKTKNLSFDYRARRFIAASITMKLLVITSGLVPSHLTIRMRC